MRCALVLVLGLLAAPAFAQADFGASSAPITAQSDRGSDAPQKAATTMSAQPEPQRLEDAWWTGPVIANSPAPLPPGHAYVESYVYDVSAAHVDGYGSQTYLLYGASERWTLGMRPLFGYTSIDGGGGSSRIGIGDLTLHAQYALTTYSPETRVPAIAIAIEESLPVGRYDRLDRQSNGVGNGAYTTTLGVYAQQYFWLKNGRILRGRLNVGGSFSGRANVHDLSVYGTLVGFDGDARPGASIFVDNAWEYSLTRRWVLATDFYYRHDAPTRLRDATGTRVVQAGAKAFDTFAVVPAIEYNTSSRIGVIFGMRFIAARGHNPSSITPIAALSVFL